MEDQERTCFPWIVSHEGDINIILNVTGFSVLIRNEIPIFTCASATKRSIVRIFNQTIYCKAMELKWQYPDMQSDCVKIMECFI